MLVAAAVCPATPLLIPEVASGAAPDLDEVRAAAHTAVRRLVASGAELLVVLAADADGGEGITAAPLAGSLRSFGVDLAVGASAGSQPAGPGPDDCSGLLVAAWLLDREPVGSTRRSGWRIGALTTTDQCLEIGRVLADRASRVALLVMADGSARRTEKAPGYLDPRAAGFDDETANILAAADAKALAAVDSTTASELLMLGRAPLQALAGAATVDRQSQLHQSQPPRPWRGDLLAYAAPFGVGYFVAAWEPQP
jgi:hypothetical protein